jgi:hypothetical protein
MKDEVLIETVEWETEIGEATQRPSEDAALQAHDSSANLKRSQVAGHACMDGVAAARAPQPVVQATKLQFRWKGRQQAHKAEAVRPSSEQRASTRSAPGGLPHVTYMSRRAVHRSTCSMHAHACKCGAG